jgi:hypothetical protein
VLACEVADSTGELTAAFYGRTQIAGVEPGHCPVVIVQPGDRG